MKSILFIIKTLNGGGAEKVLINILNHIDYDKYKVELLVVNKMGVYLNSVNKNVKMKYIYGPSKFKSKVLQSIYYKIMMHIYYRMPKVLYKIILGSRADTEIAFLEGETVGFLSNSCNKKSKKIAWIHTDISNFGDMRLEKEGKHYRSIDKVVCVSNDVAKVFNEIYPQYANKTCVIYNLIDCADILKKSSEKIDYKFSENTFIAIGRLIREKRFDLVIKAHKLLIKEGIDNQILILGSGEKEKELRELIIKNGVEKSVKMLGFKENPYPYLKQADGLVLASDIEGFSLVVCEAMTLGKVIISTNCTGPRELLDSGQYGIIVNTDDEVDLKEGIKRVIENKELKREYETKSNNRSEIFDINKVMNQIYKLID